MQIIRLQYGQMAIRYLTLSLSMLLASDYAENSRDRTVCLCTEQSPDVSCNGGLAKSTAAAPLESLRQISILTGSVGSCAPLRERRIIHRRGDTHWHPTQFWTSTVSCLTLRLTKVLDELPTPNMLIVLPALTPSNFKALYPTAQSDTGVLTWNISRNP